MAAAPAATMSGSRWFPLSTTAGARRNVSWRLSGDKPDGRYVSSSMNFEPWGYSVVCGDMPVCCAQVAEGLATAGSFIAIKALTDALARFNSAELDFPK